MLGSIVDINSISQFTSATISIPYNEAELGSISENDLKCTTSTRIITPSHSLMCRVWTLLIMWYGARQTISQYLVLSHIHHTWTSGIQVPIQLFQSTPMETVLTSKPIFTIQVMLILMTTSWFISMQETPML